MLRHSMYDGNSRKRQRSAGNDPSNPSILPGQNPITANLQFNQDEYETRAADHAQVRKQYIVELKSAEQLDIRENDVMFAQRKTTIGKRGAVQLAGNNNTVLVFSSFNGISKLAKSALEYYASMQLVGVSTSNVLVSQPLNAQKGIIAVDVAGSKTIRNTGKWPIPLGSPVLALPPPPVAVNDNSHEGMRERAHFHDRTAAPIDQAAGVVKAQIRPFDPSIATQWLLAGVKHVANDFERFYDDNGCDAAMYCAAKGDSYVGLMPAATQCQLLCAVIKATADATTPAADIKDKCRNAVNAAAFQYKAGVGGSSGYSNIGECVLAAFTAYSNQMSQLDAKMLGIAMANADAGGLMDVYVRR